MATYNLNSNAYTVEYSHPSEYLGVVASVRPNSTVVRFTYDAGYVQNMGVGVGGEQNPSERPTVGFLFPRN